MIPPTFCSPSVETLDDDAVVERSDVHDGCRLPSDVNARIGLGRVRRRVWSRTRYHSDLLSPSPQLSTITGAVCAQLNRCANGDLDLWSIPMPTLCSCARLCRRQVRVDRASPVAPASLHALCAYLVCLAVPYPDREVHSARPMDVAQVGNVAVEWRAPSLGESEHDLRTS